MKPRFSRRRAEDADCSAHTMWKCPPVTLIATSCVVCLRCPVIGIQLRWRKTFVRRHYRSCESGDHRLSPGDALRTIPASQLVGVTPKQEATPSRSSAVTVAFVSAVISYVVQAVYSISTFEVVSFFDSRAPFSSVRVRGFFFPLLPTSLAGRPILLNHSFDTE